MIERELDYWAPEATGARPIRVHIGMPEPHPDHGWQCTITIAGFEQPYSRPLYESDAVGAMSTALAIAPFLLRTFVAHGGRLTYQGSEELGFPVLLSQPEYCCRLRPANGSEPREISVRIGHPERRDGWSVLMVSTEDATWDRIEKRIHGNTWSQALERAAATVPSLLQEHVDRAGGGVLEEVDGEAPACRIPSERQTTARE